MITVYKIRHKVTGLFSTGGSYPSFREKGKTWSGTGQVRNHLAMHAGKESRYYSRPKHHDFDNWEVVEIAIQESEMKCTPAAEFAASKKKR